MRGESEQYSELLKSARAPHWLGLARYGIVIFALVVSVVNALLPEPNAFVAKILMPFIFVGIASLLYHIGQHVHAVHQNALRMVMMERELSGEKPDHVTEKGDKNG
ncbi:MAG: hypothetical protein O6949_06180 [Chloroflexi bacterium]|nr:hypothetical protein [Chloroflexota bacterium]